MRLNVSFTTSTLSSQIYSILDISSNKIRLCVVEKKGGEISLLAYEEKRQSSSFFIGGEIKNIQEICKDIELLFKKIESQLEVVLKNIVCNYPFAEIYINTKHLANTRKDGSTLLSPSELQGFISQNKLICIRESQKYVQSYYGYSAEETHSLFCYVKNILLDNEEYLAGKSLIGKKIKATIEHALIPNYNSELLGQIGNAIGKTIDQVIPGEYACAKNLKENNVLLIHISFHETSICIKHEGDIIGIGKVPSGIYHLFEKISGSENISLKQAQESCEKRSPEFEKHSETFLKYWGESLEVLIQEILKDTLCPRNIFIYGSGAYEFIFSYLGKDFLQNSQLSLPNEVSLLQEDRLTYGKKINKLEIHHAERIPTDIYCLVLEATKLQHSH